jgi:hypothetical protein
MFAQTDYVPFVAIALFLAAVAAFFLGTKWRAKKRWEGLLAVAVGLGLSFAGDEFDAERMPELGEVPLFAKGRAKKGSNHLFGVIDGVDVEAFDYQFTTGSGKSTQTHRQTVAVYRVIGAGLGLPRFEMRPRRWYHTVGSWFGYRFVKFDSHPRFHGAYLLRGPDEAALREWFGPTLLEYLQERPGWHIASGGSRDGNEAIVIYRDGKLVAVAEMAGFLREAAVMGAVIAPRV